MFIELTRIARSGMQGHRDYKVEYVRLFVKPESIEGFQEKSSALGTQIIISGERFEVKETIDEIRNLIMGIQVNG